MKLHFVIPFFAMLLSASQAAISISLPGNSESAQWASLRSANYPGAGGSSSFFNSTAAWPSRIAGNGTPTSSATFFKESGGGYFASSSVYDAGVTGTYSLQDLSPIGNLATIVFQLDVGAAIAVSPVLHYNGGTQSLLAQYSLSMNGLYTASSPGGPVASTNHAWQWDLGAIAEPITSYQIVWGSLNNNHLTQFEINVAAGDTFAQVIPETSSAFLATFAALGLLRRRRA
jgi:hypothetical protein